MEEARAEAFKQGFEQEIEQGIQSGENRELTQAILTLADLKTITRNHRGY